LFNYQCVEGPVGTPGGVNKVYQQQPLMQHQSHVHNGYQEQSESQSQPYSSDPDDGGGPTQVLSIRMDEEMGGNHHQHHHHHYHQDNNMGKVMMMPHPQQQQQQHTPPTSNRSLGEITSGKFIVRESEIVAEVSRPQIISIQRRVSSRSKSATTNNNNNNNFSRSRPYSQGDPFIEDKQQQRDDDDYHHHQVKSQSVSNFKNVVGTGGVSGPLMMKGGCQRVLVKPVGGVNKSSNSFLLIERDGGGGVELRTTPAGNNNVLMKNVTLSNGIGNKVSSGSLGSMGNHNTNHRVHHHPQNKNMFMSSTEMTNGDGGGGGVSVSRNNSKKCRHLSIVSVEDVVKV
jgi:hypothetical protein